MLTSGRTKSVQDAPTTNDHGCTEAKPSEYPKGDSDNKSEVYFKNSLSKQTKRPHLITGAVLLILNLIASQDYRQTN